MKPTLSVVLPIYNSSCFLEAALSSIEQQQQSPFTIEIIAVNDASPDNSLALLKQLKLQYSNLSIIDLPENQGVSAARNAGIKAARGEWLSFIDHDDCWHPKKLQRECAYLESHPECDFVVSQQQFTLASGSTQPNWTKPGWFDHPQAGYVFGTLLIKRSDFLRVGLLDEAIVSGVDDVKWFIQAELAGLIHHHLKEPLLTRTIHNHNLSAQTKASNQDLLMLLREKIGAANTPHNAPKKPTFSVIMPAYNAEKTVREALHSALEQLNPCDEIIVVDDASIDATFTLIKTIADSDTRIHSSSNEKNAGIAITRNRAIAMAKGDYLIFLDADDVWPAGRHQAVCDATTHHQPDVLSGMIEHFYCPSLNQAEAAKYQLPATTHASIPGTVIVKRTCAQAAGLFNPALNVGEFIDWILRVKTLATDWKKIDTIFLLRRIHGNNHTLLHRADQSDYLTIVRQHLARGSKNKTLEEKPCLAQQKPVQA